MLHYLLSQSNALLFAEELFPMDMSDSEEAELTPVGSAEDGLMSLTSMGRTISMPVIQGSTSMTEDWCNSHSASAFHPFSDTDITPITRWVVAFCSR